jgi:DNA invertase Pin-like site-specific DNA recombinase
MTDSSKIKPVHTQRAAFVYIRQSSPSQVENNRESTARQYALVNRACELGWPPEQVTVIDEDLGISGASAANRSGFTRMISEVALGRVGIVLGLEVSRLARNNADWYRLLDLCGMTDTLIGDSDGLYHPALFNDRLVLGLKGTMSEAELHIIRARLEGGIRNKAARGELRRGLPIGFVWGEQNGEVRFHPDQAVTGAVRTVFDRFTELGSARKVWLWSAAKACSSLYGRAYTARSAGSSPLTRRFTMSSLIRCMLALTSTVRQSMSAMPIQRATSRNAPGACPWANGRCYFRSIIPDSSTGPPTKPIKNALMATRIRNPTTGCPLGPGL